MSVIYQWGIFPSQENAFHSNTHVKLFQLDNNVTAIASGQSHIVLLTAEGPLGWGNNQYGQLGFHGPSYLDHITDLNLPLNKQIKQIACGHSHTLLLDINGTVFSSGQGSNGALGYGRGHHSYQFRSLLQNITQISAGSFHSLAISKTKVFGWGSSKNSQLGLVKEKIYYEPQQLYVYPSYYCYGGEYCSFFAGEKGIYVTGLNQHGQLGLGHTKKVSMPKKINLQGKVYKIKGKDYIIIQLQTGQVYLTGKGSFGKYLLPTKVQFFSNSLNFSESYGLGIIKGEDKKIYVWGLNQYGKLCLETNEQIKYPVQNCFLTSLNLEMFDSADHFMVGVSHCKMNEVKQETKKMLVSRRIAELDSKSANEQYEKDIEVEGALFGEHTPGFSQERPFYNIQTNQPSRQEFLEERVNSLEMENKKQKQYINKLQKQYLQLAKIVESNDLMKRILDSRSTKAKPMRSNSVPEDQFEFNLNKLKDIINSMIQ